MLYTKSKLFSCNRKRTVVYDGGNRICVGTVKGVPGGATNNKDSLDVGIRIFHSLLSGAILEIPAQQRCYPASSTLFIVTGP